MEQLFLTVLSKKTYFIQTYKSENSFNQTSPSID